MKGKKALFLLFKILVSSLSLYVVFSKTDMKRTMTIIKGVGPAPFIIAALLYIVSQAISSYRWKLLLPEQFTLRRLFSLYMIGAFFSSFLPGVIGGDVVKAYYLNKDAKKLSVTLASIFMDRYLGYVSLMTIGIVAFPFTLSYFAGSVYEWLMPVILLTFVVGSLLFFALRIGRRFKVIAEFYDYFGIIRQKKGVIVKAVLLSVVIQLIGFAAVAVLASAMGEDIPILLLLVFLPIVITIMSMPISISGLGVREVSFVALFGLIHIAPEAATSLSLSWFFSTFIGSIPGLAAYIRHSSRLT